jgi:hypothetical protein
MLPFVFFHWSSLLLLPALALAMWAQYKVKSTYSKYSKIGTRSGMSGSDVARAILRDAEVDVNGLEQVPGDLTDHYDPGERVLRLSQGVYSGRSIAALGVAAHEVGHAIQHAHAYAPMTMRSLIYPVSNFGSTLAFPLFIGGFLVPADVGGDIGLWLMRGAILMFSFAVAFTLITLPVEFNASTRALRALSSGGYLTDDELKGAKKVLQAAALTYVASAAMAALQLLRLIILARARD